MQPDRNYVYFDQGKEGASAKITATLPEVLVIMFDLLNNIHNFLDEASSDNKQK